MRHTRDYTELKRLARMSLEPERLEAFVAFLDAEAGYALNRAVTEAKMRLSQAQEATLSLHVAGVDIERRFTRADFEAWIAQDLAAMASSVDEAMAAAGLGEAEVDKVFLTGGSSFVPAVRALFETRFGPDKVESGDQLVSIAYGLALIAREEDVSRWAA
jgi:hypothetical chaperone protein